MKHAKWLARMGTLCGSGLAGAFVLTVAPRASFAEQFVLFDATYTYTKMDADNATPNHSHYYIRERAGSERPVALVLNKSRPTNWLTPVDYRNGTVHVRLEVIDKPAGSEITQWTLCYIPNRGVPGSGGYGCTGTGTYTEKGLYEHDVTMTSWWQNDAIDWTMGILGMDLVMKDSDGGSGFTYLRPDFEKFFPTTVRITMIQVSAGSKYDPGLVPGLDGGTSEGGTARDAGSSDARADGASDASSSGAGGAGGQATGAGGQGGDGVAGAGGQGTATTTGGLSTGTTSSTTTGAAGASGTSAGASGGARGSSADATATGCNCSVGRREASSHQAMAALGAMLSAMAIARGRRSRKRGVESRR